MTNRPYALHIAAALIILISTSALANGTLSGRVTSDETGSPAIAGAVVRTEGEPTYSTITGADGSYSVSVPPDTYNVMVSAAAHTPQRASFVIANGATTTANFAPRPIAPASGSTISLPAPLEWGEPVSAPAAPGDIFPTAFADLASGAAVGAPIVSGWNDTVKPDETFTLTGVNFTMRQVVNPGSDVTVWVWARTSAQSGVLRQARIWKVTANVIMATMPEDVPFGMYLVWVENENGASLPICINRTSPTWVGPLGNTVQAGAKKRVFGKNISYGHGTSISYVYIQPSAGGAFITCPVSKVDPYSVEFTVPVGTANGNYKVFVHNGHGGVYGWGDSLDLMVTSAWARGANQVSLSPNGLDDTAAIQGAIDSLTAQPSGGTVNLAAGNFIIKSRIDIKNNVAIKGAGINSTNLLLQLTAAPQTALAVVGDKVAVSDLTVRDCAGFAVPQDVEIGRADPYWPYDCKYTNIRVQADTGQRTASWFVTGSRCEISGCEFYRCAAVEGDSWMHGCTLYGDMYGSDGGESAIRVSGDRNVLESNDVETKSWPVNPLNGSRNYMDFVNHTDLSWMVWAKRVALMGGSHSYMTAFTTKDVAVQDTKGEIIFFHGLSGQWFGNVVSNSGTTITVDANLNIMGSANYGVPLNGGGSIPDAVPDGQYTDDSCVIIVAGRGVGQMRPIVSHTESTVTVETPWRVAPDTTSQIVISPLYVDHVTYNNDLNGFPIGYNQVYSATIGYDIDGNGWRCAAENNTSRRTYSGANILGQDCSPSYWNTVAGELAYSCSWAGFGIGCAANPIGPMLLGNAFRGGEAYVTGNAQNGTIGGTRYNNGEGTVIENVKVSAKLGYRFSGVAGDGSGCDPGPYTDGSALLRNGTLTLVDATGIPASMQPVYVSTYDPSQILINNKYSGASPTYVYANGVGSYANVVPLNRVARFKGFVGYPVPDVVIPVANGGTLPWSWSINSLFSWITPTVQSAGPLTAESELGQILVHVDTSSLPEGRSWGTVTMNFGGITQTIGVCVDLAAPPSSGRKLWLKADTGVSRDAGNNVSVWSDQSGSGNDVRQSTQSFQPLFVQNAVNGWPAVRFQGTVDIMNTSGLVVSGSSSLTTFVVARPASTSTPQYLFWQGGTSSTGGYGAYLGGSANLKAGWGSASGEVTGSSVASGTWYTVTTRYNGSTHQMWVNGASAGSAAKSGSSFTSGYFSLGNQGPSPSQGWNGDIAEVLVYNRALTDAEKSTVESFLRFKYGTPTALFTATPTGGAVPVTINFDASASTDPDGGIYSYFWEYGDKSYGDGIASSHTYTTPGTYTAGLTVTDITGVTATTRMTITAAPAISSVTLTGTPIPPVDANTPVTLSVSSVGGYQVQYKFLVKDSTGWNTVRDYGPGTSFTWTPTSAGYYELKVYARNTGSTNQFDMLSNILSYPVGLLPTGMKVWLKADSGITRDGSSVSGWVDQTGTVTLMQSNGLSRPNWIDNVQNGHPVVRFVGPGQMLQSAGVVLTAGTAFTTFTAARLNSIPASTYQYLWWTGADSISGGYGAYLYITGGFRASWGSGSGGVTDPTVAAVNTWYRVSTRFNSSNNMHDLWVNGNLIGTRGKSGSNLSTGVFSVGNFGPSSGYGLYGDIGEIIIYSRNLSDTERANVDSYMQSRWGSSTAVSKDRLADVKSLPDGSLVNITSPKAAVVASGTYTDGSVYVIENDRTCGLKVLGAGTVSLWDNLTLTGVIDSEGTGEKVLRVSTVSRTWGTDIVPLGMRGAGFAANGRFVRVWGKVTARSATFLVLDDGSGAPVRVDISGLAAPIPVLPNVGDYVGVTGPSGMDSGGVPVVRPRSAADIRVY